MFDNLLGIFVGASVVRGGRDRGASRLCARRHRLLQAVALGALMLPDVAWGQVTETLPEVTVTGPRPSPVRARRAAPAAKPARSAPPTRVSAPAPSRPSAPAPAPQIPAFQAVATTPVTGLGVDRDKIPAMVQTLPAEDFSRVYSPNVTQTLEQRVPGVFISDTQGNEFTSDLRYRGFTASPLQGTPQGLAVYMQGIRVNEAFGRQLGPHPEHCHRPRRRVDQQSCLRSQRARRGDKLPDEGRFHLSRHGIRRLGRLLRPRRRLAAIRRQEWGMGPLSRRLGAQRRRLALPIAVADRALLRRSRLEGYRRGGPSRRECRRQFFRRDRADTSPASQQRLPVDLHLAADHDK